MKGKSQRVPLLYTTAARDDNIPKVKSWLDSIATPHPRGKIWNMNQDFLKHNRSVNAVERIGEVKEESPAVSRLQVVGIRSKPELETGNFE